jgi:hypothetical protein
VWVTNWYESVQPAGPTLAEHLAKRPTPIDRRIIELDGTRFLELTAESQMIPKFPSGSPIYVFDQAGNLADWTPDSGDDENFKHRWSGYRVIRSVTDDDLKTWAGAKLHD